MPFKNKKHLLHLVPHGINSDVFRPLSSTEKLIKDKKKQLFGDKQYDFVLFYNSRNVQRKKTSNAVLAFRAFCDNLTPEQAAKCVFVLHTEKVQDAGTDLPEVIKALCPNYDVVFVENKISPDEMCAMYNIADATILTSSNEGFGLSIAESIMCGTPVIVNVTGGLQDQIGQVDDNGQPFEFDLNFGTNSIGKYKNHGIWAKPVFPSNRSLQGSPQTPYIFDDRVKFEDVSDAIMYWYKTPETIREEMGQAGRQFCEKNLKNGDNC
jgi:glycosyltransferase involved in cell wall biosynthesis